MHPAFFKIFASAALLSLSACAIFATRPIQEMSNTTAALKAAKEVKADILAPELYRQAREWFFRARKAYRFKDFALSHQYTRRARLFAEKAEFEAIRNGASRIETTDDPLLNAPPPPSSGGQYEGFEEEKEDELSNTENTLIDEGDEDFLEEEFTEEEDI